MRKTICLFHFQSQQPEQFFLLCGEDETLIKKKPTCRVSRTNRGPGTFQLGLRPKLPKQNITTQRCFFLVVLRFQRAKSSAIYEARNVQLKSTSTSVWPEFPNNILASPVLSWCCPKWSTGQRVFVWKKQRTPRVAWMHNFMDFLDEGGKAKVGTMNPNAKTRKPYWHHKSMILQILQIFNTHVRCKFQISVFKFLMHTSCILYICTTNKSPLDISSHINVFVQFSLWQPSPEFSQHPPVLQSFWFRIRDNSSLAIWLASFLLSCRVRLV